MHMLYVQAGNEETEKWETIAIIPLQPLPPDPENPIDGMFQLVDHEIVLPSGEHLRLYASFSENNLGTNFGALSGNAHLLDVGGFKKNLSSFEPAAFFLTPGGLQVSLCIGPEPKYAENILS